MPTPTTVTITRADGSTYTQTRVNGGYYNQEATTPSGEPVITVYKPSSSGGNSSFYGADTKTIQSQPTSIVETQKEIPKETPNFFELAGKELRSKGSYAPTIKQVSQTRDLTGIEDLQNKQSYYIRTKDYQATENLNVGTSSASALAKARRDKEEKERNLSFVGLATGASVTSAKPTTMKVNDLGYLDIQEKKSVLGSRERVEQERLGSKIMDIKKIPSDNVFKNLKAKTSDKFLERAESNIVLFKENAYNEPNFLKKQGALAFAGLGSAGLTLASIPLRPVKTAKEVGQMVIHPIKTIKGLGEEFVKNPVGTSVEFYVTGKGLHEISKPIKYVEPIEKLRRESFIRKQPKELQPVTRAILESEKAQRGIVPVSLKEIKNVNLKDIQNLKGIEPKLFEKTVREEKGIIFGSKAARVLSGGETRLPKDLDVAVKDVKGFNKAFYENIPTKIKQDINIKNQKIIRLEDKSTLADVKPLERLIPDKSILTRKGSLPIGGISDKLVIMGKGKPFLSFKSKVIENLYDIPTQRFKNVEGLKFVSFSEQTSRKAAGSLQYILEKNVKRQKDLPDYIKYLEIQKKSLSKSELLNKDVKLKKLDKSLSVLKKESKKIKIKGNIKNIEKVKESKLPSNLPSYLPKTKISNIPSTIKGKTSFIPSKIPSKLQPSRLNKVSKLNSIIPSNMKISSSSLSSVPSFSNISTLSNLNNSSLTNSNISNLSSLSNIPTSALSSFPKKSVKLPKIIDVNIFSRKIESFNRRKKKKGKSKRKVYFTPTLIGTGKQPKGLKNLFYIGGEAR